MTPAETRCYGAPQRGDWKPCADRATCSRDLALRRDSEAGQPHGATATNLRGVGSVCRFRVVETQA